MAKKAIPNKVQEQIDKYLEILKQDKLPVKKVFLFGSYAKGTPHKWSDIDLCIITPKFKDSWKASNYLWSKRKIFDINYAIEPHGFTPDDFHDPSNPLADQIKKTGIKIPV